MAHHSSPTFYLSRGLSSRISEYTCVGVKGLYGLKINIFRNFLVIDSHFSPSVSAIVVAASLSHLSSSQAPSCLCIDLDFTHDTSDFLQCFNYVRHQWCSFKKIHVCYRFSFSFVNTAFMLMSLQYSHLIDNQSSPFQRLLIFTLILLLTAAVYRNVLMNSGLLFIWASLLHIAELWMLLLYYCIYIFYFLLWEW